MSDEKEDLTMFYEEVAPLLDQVILMRKFFDEVVDPAPNLEILQRAALRNGYMDMLNENLGRHAFALAIVLLDLVEEFPEVRKAVLGD